MDIKKTKVSEVLTKNPYRFNIYHSNKDHSTKDMGYTVIEDSDGVSIANVWTDKHKDLGELIIKLLNKHMES